MSQRPREAHLPKIGGLESAHHPTKERIEHDIFVLLMADKSSGDDVTGLLASWAAGDPEALDQLTTQVYERMRLLAATFLRHERADHTLQTAALIHEAFLRLVKQQRVVYQNREQFFANVALMMRRILVDHARGRRVKKRGSGAERVDEGILEQMPGPEPTPDLVQLDDALQELEAEQPELARIVQLKFFVGLTLVEISMITGQASATIQRRWRLARAWLRQRLDGVPEVGEAQEA